MKISVVCMQIFPSQVTTSDRSWNSLGRLMGSMGVWVVFIWNGMGFDNGINQSPAQNFIFTKGHKLWECDMMVFLIFHMKWDGGLYPMMENFHQEFHLHIGISYGILSVMGFDMENMIGYDGNKMFQNMMGQWIMMGNFIGNIMELPPRNGKLYDGPMIPVDKHQSMG